MSSATSSIPVNEEIYSCLNLDEPKSFFLFAGAGSGKTRSLVEVLKRFREENIIRLKKNAQKVAIITYTNAASDEIKGRLEFDSAFHVSTIHSFAWELINPYINDIRSWLQSSLDAEIVDLKEKQSKTRNQNTKTYKDRVNKIESKTKRLNLLLNIKKFTYNPNGNNTSRDSLNHAEVINIAADFIQNKQLMQSILVRKYPILLIDESQDTKKELVDAFFEVQKKYSLHFTLGMFGDTMQRIYTDGKIDLGQNIPDTWARPAKEINYRCPKRIITLINKIRSDIDNQEQKPNKKLDGIVRLFILNATDSMDKVNIESKIASMMADFTVDDSWNGSGADVKVLTLEHHMAAKRGGFSDFFDSLYSVDKLKTGLLDGKLSGVSLFANQVLPLIKAKKVGNNFAVARIVRKNSLLLKKDRLNSIKEIGKANDAVNALFALWGNGDPSLSDVLKEVFNSELFQIPDVLIPIAERLCGNQDAPLEESEDESDKDSVIDAWDEALQCKFSEFEEYVSYISDESRFGTHQGIKGLEFPRVMVILDDEEARGFLFSYEKLFGVKEPTSTDIKNQKEGKDTGIDRTRRLFYVTCSRAEESLAIVAYTKEVQKLKLYVIEHGWFNEDEIIVFGSENNA